jgi:hypothetical protein
LALPPHFGKRLFLGSLLLITLPLVLWGLERKYDQADHRKALELLASRPPGAQWSVAEEMNQRASGGSYDCQSQIVSSFRGVMEVRCTVGPTTSYRFEVDLVRKGIVPLDDATRELVEAALQKAQRSPPDSGT